MQCASGVTTSGFRVIRNSTRCCSWLEYAGIAVMAVDITDKEDILVERARTGDRSAQKTLYRLHIRYLTAVCTRYIINPEDVKDVLQESFMRIFSSLWAFEYRGPGSLKGWMSRIVVNQSMKFLERSGRMVFTELTSDTESSAGYHEPDLDEVPASVIHGLIRELPDGYRTIFNLYVIEEKSHKEIAGMLNIKESTSASQLHRAKSMLAAKIKDYQTTNERVTI